MKKYLAIILTLVIAAAAFAACSKPAAVEDSTTAPQNEEQKVTETTTVPVTVEWTEEESSTEESTTEEATVSQADYDAVQTGVWYLFDDDERCAYAFEFTGKDRVEIAYFNSDNADGLDAKYFTTSEDYEIKLLEGDTVIEVTDPIKENESFMFNVKDGKVCFGKEELKNEKEVSLDAVFMHFND